MLFAVVLGMATVGSIVIRRRDPLREHARRGLAVAMGVAGVSHLVSPTPFLQHLPTWMPGREAVVLASGLVEIGFAAALLGPRRWRRATGLSLAAFLVAVFPANVYVAVTGVEVDGLPAGPYRWIRLPFQALFVWWALWSTDARPRRRGTVGVDASGTVTEPAAVAGARG